MKLSDLAIDTLKEFISGDNELTPRLTGANILKLFNKVGFKDVYKFGDGGMPEGLSRNAYVLKRLNEINGKTEMVELLEIVFNAEHFAQDKSLTIEKAVEEINKTLQQEKYRLHGASGKYNVIGAKVPDKIKVEVHFEDIQAKILQQVNAAQFSIWIAVAWFTDPVLMRAIYDKKQAGLNVRLIVLDDDINRKNGFKYEDFVEAKRMPKEGPFENIMHHKFCVIDLKTVVHGSYNWTKKAAWNKETVSVEHSRELAEQYASQFIKLMK
ncbi:phospholipase D-like domain-containing protein [Sphingobacterium siyangense]|uniref:phospholipase D n=1 Tax=Sphingobacterium siyangense TaxID=459529 RepID=A0A562MKA1_9SPHI|nr:phospholipase D-like domain-containing protein [Sphingobacterium siyangense]TWI20323.1 phospholipase D-like protein [Sphingobacterium siyangense]